MMNILPKGKKSHAKVLEQKNLKTKIKMGNEAIELFNKAMALSKIVNQTEKDEYMWNIFVSFMEL